MRSFVIRYFLVGLAGTLLVLYLDTQAFFSLSSYLPLSLAVFGYGAVGLKKAFTDLDSARRLRAERIVVIALALLVVVLGFLLPHLRTSDRKEFHLAAASLRPGMNGEAVRKVMGAYQNHDGEGGGYLAFTFRVNAHTEDRVIVDLSPDGTVRKIEVVTN